MISFRLPFYAFLCSFLFYSHEAMSDLIDVMSKLVDVKGKILIPGVNDTIAELTDEEKKLYDSIDFDKVGLTSYRFLSNIEYNVGLFSCFAFFVMDGFIF